MAPRIGLLKMGRDYHLCFICGKRVDQPHWRPFHPTDTNIEGNHIRIFGGYGSTAFDPCPERGEYLAGAVHSECLIERMGTLFLMQPAERSHDIIIEDRNNRKKQS